MRFSSVGRIPDVSKLTKGKMIAHVSDNVPPKSGPRFPHPFGDGTNRIKLTGRPFGAVEKFLRRHHCRLENDVLLPIILRPITGENPTFCIQTFEEGRIWVGNQNSDGCRIDPDLTEYLHGAPEYAAVVVIKPEY